MTNINSAKIILSEYRDIFLFIFVWSLFFVVPHFQSEFGFFMIVSQVFIALILFYTIYKVLVSKLNLDLILKPAIIFLFPLFYLASVILNSFGKDNLYVFINRFGAGSMILDGKIYMFGDLAQSTAASSCNITVQIGKNICDPFLRQFNQNPHIIDILKIINFKNTFLLGLASTLLFFTLILLIAYKNQISILTLIIILLSPPIVLAIDRGNEIITSLLILPGLYLITKQNNVQSIGAFLLAFSVFYKLWPVVLILFLLVLLWKKVNISSKIIMILPLIYWFYFQENAFRMVEYTLKGSPISLSFGLKHYLNSTIRPEYLIFFCILIALLSISFLLKSKLFDQNLYRESTDLIILNTLFLTYIFTWILGISFIYRLIIFIPTLIFLNRAIKENSRRAMLESLIILTMLTSKLSVTTVFTSILAIIFSSILAYQLALAYKKRSVNNYQKINKII